MALSKSEFSENYAVEQQSNLPSICGCILGIFIILCIILPVALYPGTQLRHSPSPTLVPTAYPTAYPTNYPTNYPSYNAPVVNYVPTYNVPVFKFVPAVNHLRANVGQYEFTPVSPTYFIVTNYLRGHIQQNKLIPESPTYSVLSSYLRGNIHQNELLLLILSLQFPSLEKN
jgi:hypothetical protein